MSLHLSKSHNFCSKCLRLDTHVGARIGVGICILKNRNLVFDGLKSLVEV